MKSLFINTSLFSLCAGIFIWGNYCYFLDTKNFNYDETKKSFFKNATKVSLFDNSNDTGNEFNDIFNYKTKYNSEKNEHYSFLEINTEKFEETLKNTVKQLLLKKYAISNIGNNQINGKIEYFMVDKNNIDVMVKWNLFNHNNNLWSFFDQFSIFFNY